MRRKPIMLAVLLIVVLAGGAGFALMRELASKNSAAPASPPVPIVAGTVAQHDVPIYLTGVGTVVAYNTVVVRSQIQGQLVSINFKEGQKVHAGDLLAQIDPRPYQAQIEQLTANRDRDQAQLTNALANLDRYTSLAKTGDATPQLLDTQKAQVSQLQNAVKSDQALIDAANVQLSYTRLTSPIDGIVGIRQIDIGNIIHPTDPNGLVVATQIEPISVTSRCRRPTCRRSSSSRRRPRLRSRFSPTARTARSSWTRARSRWSTTRSCRRPARSSSRRSFPTRRIGCGRASSSACGCYWIRGMTA